MLFVEDLKPLKIYKRPLFLPTIDGDKKKGSAIFLLTPNFESSKALMNHELLINRMRFSSYYLERNLTFFLGKQTLDSLEDAIEETYIRNMSEYDRYQSLYEMTAKQRNALPDSSFGVPSKRKFPLDSKARVKSAIRFFNYVDEEDEKTLAANLKKAIKRYKLKVNVGEKNRFSKYYHEDTSILAESSEQKEITSADSTLISVVIFDGDKVFTEYRGNDKVFTIPHSLVATDSDSFAVVFDMMQKRYGITIEDIYQYGETTYSELTDTYPHKCFIVKSYSGSVTKSADPEVSEIAWKSFEELQELPMDNVLLAVSKMYFNSEDNVSDEEDDNSEVLMDKITCSGYSGDLKVIKYIATPNVYRDLLNALELSEDDFTNGIPSINITAGDSSNVEYNNDTNTIEIMAPCKMGLGEIIKGILTEAIVGIIAAKFPSISPRFSVAIAEYIVGKGSDFITFVGMLIKKYSMRGLLSKLAKLEYNDIFDDAKTMGYIKTAKDLADFKEEIADGTLDEAVSKIAVSCASPRSKYSNGILKNSASKLQNSITESICIPNKDAVKKEISVKDSAIVQSLKEGSYIITGDYVSILTEDAANDAKLRKILYKERIVKRKDIIALLDKVKQAIPYIKYAFPSLDRYKNRNLFIDLYYYNEVFFRNNTNNILKSYSLYMDMLDKIINDTRITSEYKRRTVFVPVNDWNINNSTKMWFYKQGINPISLLFQMINSNPNEAKNKFKNVTFIFFDDHRYFTIDLTDTANAKKNLAKFRLFINKFNTHEEIESEEDNTDITDKGIKANLIDKIEKERGIDLTKKCSDLEKSSGEALSQSVASKIVVKAVKKTDDAKNDSDENQVSKLAANKSVAMKANEIDKEREELELARKVITISKTSDMDAANDYIDQSDARALVAGLSNDSEVKISDARRERFKALDAELMTKTIKGKSIKDIIESDTGLVKDMPSTALPISSPNEEWKDMKYINFDKTYSLEADLIRVFKAFENTTYPIAVRNITAVDNSTSEDKLDLYTVEYEDYNGKRYTIKLDIPKIKNKRFMLRGNAKTMQTQFFNMPIVKTDLDTCQIVTNYRKIIISRYNGTSGKSLPYVSKFVKAITKTDIPGIKYTEGNNTKVCTKYALPVDYIDLASIFRTIETRNIIFYFDQDEIRSMYNIDDINGIPYAYNKQDKTISYYNMDNADRQSSFIKVLIDNIVSDLSDKSKSILDDAIYMAKAPDRLMYTRAKILGYHMPLILVCAFSEGLTKVLNKAGITYRFTEKLTNDEKHNPDLDYIKFSDGFLLYDVTYDSSLLLNGLKELNTESFSFTEVDGNSIYLNALDDYGGRIKSDGLNNFYDCEIDPITKETLQYYNLPLDYVSVLLHANHLLADNKFTRHTDTSSRRARRFELIAGYTYQVLSEAYGVYATGIRHSRNGATFSCKQSAVIDAILSDPTSSDYSVINVLNDIEATNAITTKGLTGLNSDRSYSLDKRTYDDSMVGVIGMSTGQANTVGITRQATLNMNIDGKRGYVNSSHGTLDQMNAANTLTATESVVPFSVTHDDPARVAMTFIQTCKHAMRTADSDPLLVSNGADQALPYICSDQFAFKAKNKGKIIELTDKYIIVEYEDKTKDYINLDISIEKNSDGGFYNTLKLDADPKLKVGSKVDAGQIIAWDRLSMSNDIGEDDNLAYNVGKLAKIAIVNIEEGFEDSGICTEEIATKLASKITNKSDCILDKSTNVYNVAKVGQHVEEGDTLLTWQTPYDEEEMNKLLRNLAGTDESVAELGRNNIRSKYTGTVIGIKVYRTVPVEELSPSLQELVKNYEAPIISLKNKLDSNGIDSSDLPATYQLKPVGKLKKVDDGVLIEFYVEYLDTLGVGDKITYNAANKAVIKNIIPIGKEPYTDFRPNEHISAFVSVTSIDKRMVCSTITYGALQKLMVELDRSCKDLAGIPYDDSTV